MNLRDKFANALTAPSQEASASLSSETTMGLSYLLSGALSRAAFPANSSVAPWPDLLSSQPELQSARSRHPIYRAGEVLPGVPIICDGWAARVRRISDGRRQILSFLLPGDLVSPYAIFTERLSFSVETITSVRYGYVDRAQFTEQLAAEPGFLAALMARCLAEKEEADQLATNLGRRRAEERIACLFLHLMERLEARGMVQDRSFVFPLRQQHIADATGLTSVHVNRVIGALRSENLIELNNGVLKILNLAGMQRIAA